MNILVHGANWIGDAVMTIPALRELKKAFGDSSITLYSRPWAKDIFRDCDFISEVLAADPGAKLFREARRWRKRKPDAALIFPNSFRTALISRLAGVPSRIGYANEGRGVLLTKSVRKPAWKEEKHEIFYYLELTREFIKRHANRPIAAPGEPDTHLPVSDQRKKAAREQLAASGASGKKVICFGVGSQNSRAKRWLPSRYAELADHLSNDPGADVVLLGSAEEKATASKVVAGASKAPINLVGSTGLAEAVALISVCDLFVSNDMGLAHVASAVGTPTITIFGPTNALTTRPWNGEIIRRDDVECSPCMLRDCPIDHRCMEWIPSATVHEKVKAILLQN